MGDWKLAKFFGAPGSRGNPRNKATIEGAELYRLATDLGETKNFAASELERVTQLEAAWSRWNADNVEPAWYPELPAATKQKAGDPKAASKSKVK